MTIAPACRNATEDIQTLVPVSEDPSPRLRIPRRWDSEGDRTRFYLNLYHATPTGCWNYLGTINPSGYGVAGGSGAAHRFFYENLVGPIEAGLQLDHLCRNRKCVNPAHLEPVTQRENLRRGVSFSAINAAKTHCPQGHEYTPENTIVNKRGETQRFRICKACQADRRVAAAAARTRGPRGPQAQTQALLAAVPEHYWDELRMLRREVSQTRGWTPLDGDPRIAGEAYFDLVKHIHETYGVSFWTMATYLGLNGRTIKHWMKSHGYGEKPPSIRAYRGVVSHVNRQGHPGPSYVLGGTCRRGHLLDERNLAVTTRQQYCRQCKHKAASNG